MVGPRKIKEIIRSENSFMGLEFPKLDGVSVTLSSSQEITKSAKTGEILSKESENFKIEISFIEYNNRREDIELSEKIKNAVGLNFAPYQRSKGYYHFYTTSYTPEEKKIEIFKNLIKIAKEYVEEKKDEVIIDKNSFDEDIKESLTLESNEMMLMPYHAQGLKPSYLLVLKEKVGASTYSLLARESFYNGYLTIRQEGRESDIEVSATVSSVQEYFPNFKRKAAFFIISPQNYGIIKTFVQSEIAKESFYYDEQVKKGEKSKEMIQDIEYTEENIFGVSIQYLEDKGVFLFKGKGYKDGGSLSVRTKIGLWANNFIYSEKTNWENKVHSKEFYLEDSNKIELNMVTSGSAKDGYLIPLSEIHKLKKIKENLLRELEVWGRQELLIDVFKDMAMDSYLKGNYPFVYVTDEGNAFFCHSSRQKFSSKEGKIVSTTFKGFEINKKEAQYFLKEHPFSSNIKDNSRLISVASSAAVKDSNDFACLTDKNVAEIFNVLLLNFQMKKEVEMIENKTSNLMKF